jgi:hypothetical protein
VKLRLAVGYGAIICVVPYVTLKAIWLCGGSVGVADADQMRSLAALNVLTGVMGLVGIASALTFTHAWGLRVPAWLVLPPAWVATGLLIRFVLAVPLAILGGALSEQSIPAGGPVHAWVYALVYIGFLGLGTGLSAAFVLYARVRWESLFQPTGPPLAAGAVVVPLANTAAVIALAMGVLRIIRAFSSAPLTNTVDGVTMIAGGFGILALIHPFGRRLRPWVPPALTWVGSGFLFGWGLWNVVNVLGRTPLVRDRVGSEALLNFVGLGQLLAGLVMGLVMLFVLSERVALARESRSSEPVRLSGI